MIRIMIPALLFSILVGQSNPIDIGTVGARQLRMGGQLNISHNPATLGYLATTTDADTVNAIEESVDSLVSDFSDEIEQEMFEENIAETDTVDSEFAEFDDFEETNEDTLSNNNEEIYSLSDFNYLLNINFFIVMRQMKILYLITMKKFILRR